MTIEYKDSKRIVKLSTDTVETITFSDNSFTSGWDKAGTQIATNSGSGEIDWNARVNGTNHSLVHDLQDELGCRAILVATRAQKSLSSHHTVAIERGTSPHLQPRSPSPNRPVHI